EQARYRDLASEGLARATAVVGATRDVLARTAALVPASSHMTIVIPPGVDVDRFRPKGRAGALRAAREALLGSPEAMAGGRPSAMDDDVRDALSRRDAAALDLLALTYDQDAADPEAPDRLLALATGADPLIGYLGKFIPQKGVHDLLTALPRLRRAVDTVLVGFGGFREWLGALVFALRDPDVPAARWLEERWPERLEIGPPAEDPATARGNADRVTFTGRLDHRFAPEVLAALDVLVVPSVLPEAFGMV